MEGVILIIKQYWDKPLPFLHLNWPIKFGDSEVCIIDTYQPLPMGTSMDWGLKACVWVKLAVACIYHTILFSIMIAGSFRTMLVAAAWFVISNLVWLIFKRYYKWLPL